MFKKGWQPENYKGVHDEIKQQHMKTKDMSAKGRFEYFWYYYKVHTLVAVCVIIFGGSLIHDILTAKDYGFYGVMLNASLLDSEAMEASFGEYAQLDLNEYDCMIDTQSQLSYHSQNSYDFATYQKLVAQLQTHELDVLVADAEVFRNFATNEMFMDLREFMSPEELAKYEDRIYYVDMEAVRKAAEAADNVLNEEESTADDAAPQDASGTQEAEELSPDEAEAAINPFGRNIDYDEIYRLAAEEAKTHRHPEEMAEPVPVGIFLDESPFTEKTGSYGKMVPVYAVVVTSEKADTAVKYLNYLWDDTVPFDRMLNVF
ncbi:MAG: hypothetical protein K2P71_11060 [Lachnospiraceae bacterium]|nr:hypothetical protein [Lachnospiraceae bacterium]